MPQKVRFSITPLRYGIILSILIHSHEKKQNLKKNSSKRLKRNGGRSRIFRKHFQKKRSRPSAQDGHGSSWNPMLRSISYPLQMLKLQSPPKTYHFSRVMYGNMHTISIIVMLGRSMSKTSGTSWTGKWFQRGSRNNISSLEYVLNWEFQIPLNEIKLFEFHRSESSISLSEKEDEGVDMKIKWEEYEPWEIEETFAREKELWYTSLVFYFALCGTWFSSFHSS